MLNNSLNVGKPLAARVVSTDYIGQAGHDWYHVLGVFSWLAGASINHSARRASVSKWKATVVLEVDKKPVSSVINSSTELLQPCIAKDEVDRNRIA